MSIVAIACGGRNLTYKWDYEDFLMNFHKGHRLVYVIVGSLVGADALAYNWAERHGIDRLCHDANWKKYERPREQGRNPAGPIRNGELLVLQQFLADLLHAERAVLALPGGDGTKDMCTQAAAAGVDVYRYGAPVHDARQGSLL